VKVYQRAASERASVPVVGDDLLTAGEVAALLRMTSAWVYAETRRNRIPHLRLGRYVRYRRSTIVAWMSEVEASSDASAPDVPRLRFSS
jgi:excisionase family DNA binding protein